MKKLQTWFKSLRYNPTIFDEKGLKLIPTESFSTLLYPRNESEFTFILTSGTSESGKSHLGSEFLNSNFGNRFKIYKLLTDLSKAGLLPGKTAADHSSLWYCSNIKNNKNKKSICTDLIIDRFTQIMYECDNRIAILETPKHDWLVQNLKTRKEIRVLSIYIDADFSKRVKRERVRLGNVPFDVMAKVKEKDEMKRKFGSLIIKELADLVIYNNSSIKTYNKFINMFAKHLRKGSVKFKGNAVAYMDT